MQLQNSTFLITGGTLGIGYATAKLLIQHGAKVAITGRTAGTVQRAADELGALGITANVANPADVERTFREFIAAFGHLDCLINNAGIGVRKNLVDLTPEDFEQVHSTNIVGAALMAQQAAKLFMEQKSGNIINIGSSAATKGYEGGSVYVASKFALRGMTQCWQAELRKYNVRVILVNPSEVTTAFGNEERRERPDQDNKLRGEEIASAIKGALEMDDRGFITELNVWATNPF
ncbi:SDR family oxidoreductase [Hymenobacter sp. HD11105]|jgi:3-oxoacyl-[acyl-carrier protein] reductase